MILTRWSYLPRWGWVDLGPNLFYVWSSCQRLLWVVHGHDRQFGGSLMRLDVWTLAPAGDWRFLLAIGSWVLPWAERGGFTWGSSIPGFLFLPCMARTPYVGCYISSVCFQRVAPNLQSKLQLRSVRPSLLHKRPILVFLAEYNTIYPHDPASTCAICFVIWGLSSE